MMLITDLKMLRCVVVCVLQVDPSGPSFQTVFNSTEQMLKVGGERFHRSGIGDINLQFAHS